MTAEIKAAFASDLAVLTGENWQSDVDTFPLGDPDKLLCEGIAGMDTVIKIIRGSVYSTVNEAHEVDEVISRSMELIKLRDQCLSPKHVNEFVQMTFTCFQYLSKDIRKAYSIEDTSNLSSPIGDGFHLFEIMFFYACLNHFRDLLSGANLAKVMRQMRDVLYPLSDTILTPEEERFTNEVMEAFFVPQRSFMREVKKRIISLVRTRAPLDQVEAGKRLLSSAVKERGHVGLGISTTRNLSYFMMSYLEGGFLFESPEQAVSSLYALIAYFDSFTSTPGRVSKSVWIDHLVSTIRKSTLVVEICYYHAKHKNIKVRNFEHHVCKAGPPSPIAGRIVPATSLTPIAKPSFEIMAPPLYSSPGRLAVERGRSPYSSSGLYGARSVSQGPPDSSTRPSRNIFAHSLLSFTDTFTKPTYDVSQQVILSPHVIRESVEPYQVDDAAKSPRTPRTVPLVSEYFAPAHGVSRASVPQLFDSVLRVPPPVPGQQRQVPEFLKERTSLSPPRQSYPTAQEFPSSVLKGVPFAVTSPPRSPLRHPGRLSTVSSKDRTSPVTRNVSPSPGRAGGAELFESLEKTRDLVYKSLVKAGMSPDRSNRVAAQFTEGPEDVEALKRAVSAAPPPASSDPMQRIDSLMHRAESAVKDGRKLSEVKAIMAEIRDLAKSQQ